jgi:hypothetical protein
MLVTALLLPLSYFAIGALRGLPADSLPPAQFKLRRARVVGTNTLQKEEGQVYLWLEELDDQNYPSGMPRACALPWDTGQLQKVETAVGKIQGVKEMSGRINEVPTEAVDPAEDLAREAKPGVHPGGVGRCMVGERCFEFDPAMLNFGETLPASGANKPGGDLEQRRLARAVRPQQAEHLAPAHCNADPFNAGLPE